MFSHKCLGVRTLLTNLVDCYTSNFGSNNSFHFEKKMLTVPQNLSKPLISKFPAFQTKEFKKIFTRKIYYLFSARIDLKNSTDKGTQEKYWITTLNVSPEAEFCSKKRWNFSKKKEGYILSTNKDLVDSWHDFWRRRAKTSLCCFRKYHFASSSYLIETRKIGRLLFPLTSPRKLYSQNVRKGC